MKSPRKPDEDDVEIGVELRKLREAANLTQAQVAERVGVSTQQYRKYESGENSIKVKRYQQALRAFGQPTSGFGEGAQANYSAPAKPLKAIKSDFERVKTEMTGVFSALERYLTPSQ